MGLDGIKSVPVYSSGGFVDTYNTSIQHTPAGYATGERYRYLDDGVSATSEKYQCIEDNDYQTVSSRYAGERTMLYVHGSPVAINRSSGTRGYLGTDILGSTRSVTDNHGVQESYYDYDIFGSPVAGDFTTGADYGYLGKPYDSITGLYNYGYRDYSPQVVRFTTVDPIRAGSNWFAYVNNDPVNYVDLWGLLASEPERSKNNFSRFVDTVKGLFKDDGSEQIFTYGLSASATGIGISGAVGAGVYVNPKNNALHVLAASLMKSPITSGVGMTLMAMNVEDVGGYAEVASGTGLGLSASAGVSAGVYRSKEDAAGAYVETGLSGGPTGTSFGFDIVYNYNGEIIGGNFSAGIGVSPPNVPAEGHIRFGHTTIMSFVEN